MTVQLRAAIATRYSSDKQHEHSLEDQERNCRREIKRRGWVVVEEWVCSDAAKSGASVAGRESFLRLLDGARSAERPFDAVVVDDLSRLTREAGTTMSVFKDLKQRGILLVGVSDGFDSDRRGAKFEAGLRGLMNEAYLDDLAEKTHRGLEGQFLRGFHAGGHLFGYRSEHVFEADGRTDAHGERAIAGYSIQIEEPEAEVIRRIFRLYVEENLSVNDIARRLNAEGIPWPGANTKFAAKRKGWAHSSVVALLDSEKYAGRWVWNRSRWFKDSQSGRRRCVERPETEWQRKEIPKLAIISRATWDLAQARREEMKKKFPGFKSGQCTPGACGRAPKHLLSGLLVCGHCGGAISVIGSKKKMTANGPVTYLKYACLNASRKGRAFCENGRTIGLLKIENKIINGLRERMLHPVAVKEFVNKFIARAKSKTSEVMPRHEFASLNSRIEKLKRDAEKLMDLYLASDSQAPEAVRARLEKCESERRGLERQAHALRRAPKPADFLPDPRTILKYADELSATLAGDRQKARAALERHVGKITLTVKNEGPTPTYWASGLFDFGPVDESRRAQGVAGAGFEPATFGL